MTYPWERQLDPPENVFQFRFKECQFYNPQNPDKFLTPQELEKSPKEIEKYCSDCGICCYLPDFNKLEMDERAQAHVQKITVDKDWFLTKATKCEFLEVEEVEETEGDKGGEQHETT